jgi:hypothetical protein
MTLVYASIDMARRPDLRITNRQWQTVNLHGTLPLSNRPVSRLSQAKNADLQGQASAPAWGNQGVRFPNAVFRIGGPVAPTVVFPESPRTTLFPAAILNRASGFIGPAVAGPARAVCNPPLPCATTVPLCNGFARYSCWRLDFSGSPVTMVPAGRHAVATRQPGPQLRAWRLPGEGKENACCVAHSWLEEGKETLG